MVPLVSILSGFLIGWWAVAEIFNYEYTLFEGPIGSGDESDEEESDDDDD